MHPFFFSLRRFSLPLRILCALLLMGGCKPKTENAALETNGAFMKEHKTDAPHVNRIIDSGELIIATLSGPDTYFEYQGKGFGLQYALACNFAEHLGVSVRVEMCSDTLQMVQMLDQGDVDLLALQIPENSHWAKGLVAAGASSKAKDGTVCSWMVKRGLDDFTDELNNWFGNGVEVEVERVERNRLKQRCEVRRKVRAPFISKEKGIISTYDNYFKEAAQVVGWDWRLIAAQCYQESGFDPNAVSWAGASGLMQIMPSTAQQYHLPQEALFRPAENVAAAARILKHLQSIHSNIADPAERMKFVLASYNAGPGHVADAQALARKYGHNAHRWDEVGTYILGLSQAKYYRDPVVRHGYMIGSETYHYVANIMDRWAQYGGSPAMVRAGMGAMPSSHASSSGERVPHKRNRFSKEQKILSPEELAKQ